MTECNALSQCTTMTWDTTLGQIKTVTDPNGDTLALGYDVLGRPASIRYPDGSPQLTTHQLLRAADRRIECATCALSTVIPYTTRREHDPVKIADDFTPPEDTDQRDDTGHPIPGPSTTPKPRLAYVAVTRVRHRLDRTGLAWIDHYPDAVRQALNEPRSAGWAAVISSHSRLGPAWVRAKTFACRPS